MPSVLVPIIGTVTGEPPLGKDATDVPSFAAKAGPSPAAANCKSDAPGSFN